MPRKRKQRDQDGVYRRPDSPNWWASYVDASGKRVRRSTGTTERKEAEALLAKWRLEAHKVKQWGEAPDVSFEELMVEYLSAHDDKRSAVTDRIHAQQLRQSLAGMVMDRLPGTAITTHIRRRKRDGVGPATINRELALLSSAINHWNKEYDAMLPNPVRGKKQREPEGRIRWITKEEAERLVQAARLAKRAPYLVASIQLALNTGMRREEMLGLEWGRVDLRQNLIYLEADHTKAIRRRTVPLNTTARNAILAQARFRATQCPDSRWVFCRKDGTRIRTAADGFERACSRAGIEDFRFHDLRHTCAAWLIQAGVPLAEVRDVLGHSTITMTERYAHLAPHNIRNAVSMLDAFQGIESRSSHVGTSR